ncbi:thiamine-phosphate kinase [Fictibacillus terranigra]|uniref:Thiamine-monophosphate kinase n=1 Tax=Fictibacillus terranigra TaxID=3058424 RepID=A0ABT8ED48_9BACL|nr:thiamine-phosphate kinase [Fictibacillus sp. CENA-BCM004]MDN4075835.1 thiamine-phosphate kinase [Fictibacillus sp. CENA-BCM004]
MKDEFEWIKTISPASHKQSSLILGIGDDAALIKGSALDQIVCLDTMVEGVHFTKATLTPFHIGHKALAANISDIAAMGGIPLFYLVSISIPAGWDEEELSRIYKGMAALAEEYEMDLIGGDTVSTTGPLVLSVTVLGQVEQGRKLLRSNAEPDDLVFVSGPVGDSAAGLSLLLERSHQGKFSKEESLLVKEHQLPLPHVEAGRILAKSDRRVALNDISDGVASEAHEIAEASGVSITLFYDKLPKSEAIKHYPGEMQDEWMLFGGEDYKLIGTMSPDGFPEVQAACEKAGCCLTVIGRVSKGSPGVVLDRGTSVEKLSKAGYNHFSD